MRRLLRPREAAEILGCSRSAVYDLIRRGAIPHVRLSAGIVRVPEDELEAFLRARVKGGEPEEGGR
ncbi:MAG TPA: helix-turn-helix domain-containing protein [Actinomycetota bacterium]|nr:helix-turn-helix domain-containing protein [Actinomycetota bacterium]